MPKNSDNFLCKIKQKFVQSTKEMKKLISANTKKIKFLMKAAALLITYRGIISIKKIIESPNLYFSIIVYNKYNFIMKCENWRQYLTVVSILWNLQLKLLIDYFLYNDHNLYNFFQQNLILIKNLLDKNIFVSESIVQSLKTRPELMKIPSEISSSFIAMRYYTLGEYIFHLSYIPFWIFSEIIPLMYFYSEWIELENGKKIYTTRSDNFVFGILRIIRLISRLNLARQKNFLCFKYVTDLMLALLSYFPKDGSSEPPEAGVPEWKPVESIPVKFLIKILENSIKNEKNPDSGDNK